MSEINVITEPLAREILSSTISNLRWRLPALDGRGNRFTSRIMIDVIFEKTIY